MLNKKGFTLVELLVAATIIGALVVFATVQYRNGAAETRWAEAKGKARQLQNALQRLWYEYPTAVISSGDGWGNNTEACHLYHGVTNISANQLMACGFLENGTWNIENDYFLYHICASSEKYIDGTVVATGTRVSDKWASCPTDYNAYVCVTVRESAVMPADYKSKMYCVDRAGTEHEATL